jgi:hypothetical protein
MKRRHLMWLWAAILLLAAATALMMYGAEPAPERAEVSVNFPRRLKSEERKRMERRRVLPLPPPPVAGAPVESTPPRIQDPVLAALSATGKRSAVVVEANAIRHSPIGKLLLQCLMDEAREDPIERMRQETGVDLLQDLDRVAMTEDNVILSGHFANARWMDLFEGRATQSAYGDSAMLFRPTPREGGADGGPRRGRGPGVLAAWNDQMLIVGEEESTVREAIDRIEGRAPVGEPIIGESQTYGEIYGVLSAEDVARLFPPENEALAERFRAAAERIEIHVDTTRDVGVVTHVRGPDGAAVSDLGKSLGAALSLARLQAQAEGEKDLVEFLDLARVNPDDGQFRLEMAIPLELMEKHLSRCGERRRERERRAAEAKQKAAEQGQPPQAP